jgi:flagellar biosynthesis protein FlhF
MSTADLVRVAARFQRFSPAGLIFTRLDEAGAWGAMWTVASELGLPIEFWSNGQQIPDDVEQASAGRLVESIVQACGGEAAADLSANYQA